MDSYEEAQIQASNLFVEVGRLLSPETIDDIIVAHRNASRALNKLLVAKVEEFAEADGRLSEDIRRDLHDIKVRLQGGM